MSELPGCISSEDYQKLQAQNKVLRMKAEMNLNFYKEAMHQRDRFLLEKKRFQHALEEIRDQDYRGNRCSCSGIAFDVLGGKK